MPDFHFVLATATAAKKEKKVVSLAGFVIL